jgi:hypothetical protein
MQDVNLEDDVTIDDVEEMIPPSKNENKTNSITACLPTENTDPSSKKLLAVSEAGSDKTTVDLDSLLIPDHDEAKSMDTQNLPIAKESTDAHVHDTACAAVGISNAQNTLEPSITTYDPPADENQYDDTESTSTTDISAPAATSMAENEAENEPEDVNADEAEDYRGVLYNAFTSKRTATTFAVGGEIPSSVGTPGVAANGERIAYPLCKAQAKELLALAELAPFGKGTETVFDTNVRQVWQIDPSMIKINEQWLAKSLPILVVDIVERLGMDPRSQVEAHFYKMLLYEAGGHFKKHKDTEKEVGMFGSLLIQLPAEHEGGELFVEHGSMKKTFSFAKDSAKKAFYSAFYADCDHTLLPVTNGYRLVLAFNLVRLKRIDVPLSISFAADRMMSEVRAAVRNWADDPSRPMKLAHPLEFKYTNTNLSFAGLKGGDRQLVNRMRSFTDEKGAPLFRFYLAMFTKHVTGPSDEDYGYKGSYSMMEITETTYATELWVSEDGECSTVEELGGMRVSFPTEILKPVKDVIGGRPDKK